MLEVGNGGMTADEYWTHMSLWALLAAPLMSGDDLRTMSEETKSILMNTDVIAIDQDRDAKPVQRLSQQGKSEVLIRALRGNAVAVGLFNRGDSPADRLPMGRSEIQHGPLRVSEVASPGPVEARTGPGLGRRLYGKGAEARRVVLRVAIAPGRGGF